MFISEWLRGNAYLEVRDRGIMIWVVRAVNGFVSCISGSRVSYTAETLVHIFIVLTKTIIPIAVKADKRRSPWLKRSLIGDRCGIFMHANCIHAMSDVN